MMRRTLAGAVLLWAGHAWAVTDPQLTEKQKQAVQQQAELRARIKVLQDQIARDEASRHDAALALKESEAAISAISRRLAQLQTQVAQAETELNELEAGVEQQTKNLADRRHELAEQLKAQYTSGLSPWTALLSGDDPRTIGRDLSYLGYVSAAQTQAVRNVSDAVTQLQTLQNQARIKKDELAALAQHTKERQAELEAQKKERGAVLQRIESDLKEQRGQTSRLVDNEERLGQLISDLEAEIARQAERARQAEEARRLEAERQAEQAREDALAQQQALEQERERARLAEQAAREAQEQTERERLQRDAEQARLQVERARQESEEADRAAAARRAEITSLRGAVPGVGQPGAMTGLSKNLLHPVNGEVQGRFGGQRPEGGIWRGIVLRSPEGTHVRAIASGRVAFASWLSGFGNILIIDHGEQYMSVYAYNQSLLKEVGDPVGTGDIVATVGATGGQVEPGLYFEIRHQGKPINPLLWLKP